MIEPVFLIVRRATAFELMSRSHPLDLLAGGEHLYFI